MEQSEGITTEPALAETANVAWKRAVHAKQDPAAIRSSLSDCIAFISEACELIPTYTLVEPAYELACLYRITIYAPSLLQQLSTRIARLSRPMQRWHHRRNPHVKQSWYDSTGNLHRTGTETRRNG
ncbi:MAG: hypothetical protein WC379_11795 [Methanoregula sp.]